MISASFFASMSLGKTSASIILRSRPVASEELMAKSLYVVQPFFSKRGWRCASSNLASSAAKVVVEEATAMP